jgi:AcrR family transcriptional regulator
MSKTKERLLRSGEKLFAAQGYSGTGLKQLADEARAPWSSMYHFFPDGKEQLAGEILRYAGQLYAAPIERAFAHFREPAAAVAAMFAGEIETLKSTQFRQGCPVAAVTLDVASTVEKVRKPCADAFAAWVASIARGIAASGVSEEEAAELATFILASLEGAIVLSRAAKSVVPLERTARFVRNAVAAACRKPAARRISKKRATS